MVAGGPKNVALAFVEKINAHDVEGLCALMTDTHLFIDSVNSRVRGRESMRKAWLAYFHMVPDFTIEITHVMLTGSTVGLFGKARGTFSPDGTLQDRNRWEMPSAWRALVRDDLVAEWQVYADNEPVRVLMSSPTY
jgi:ketosteroid isomerase-like protein